MDYRIFITQVLTFCKHTHTHAGDLGLYSRIRRTFVKPAQNLTPEKSQGGCKAYYVKVTHPYEFLLSIYVYLKDFVSAW